MKKTKKSTVFLRALLTFLTVFLIGFIFSNSVQIASVSSASSGRVVAFLNSICSFLGLTPFFTQEIVRPLAHFGEFGLLGVLSVSTYLSYFGVKVKTFLLAVGTFLLTAFTDECIQLFTSGRAFQFSDILIDASGGLLGAVAMFLIAVLINSRKRKGYSDGEN